MTTAELNSPPDLLDLPCPRCDGTGRYLCLPGATDSPCALCDGTGKIGPDECDPFDTCPQCDGAGGSLYDPAAPCSRCRGSGLVAKGTIRAADMGA